MHTTLTRRYERGHFSQEDDKLKLTLLFIKSSAPKSPTYNVSITYIMSMCNYLMYTDVHKYNLQLFKGIYLICCSQNSVKVNTAGILMPVRIFYVASNKNNGSKPLLFISTEYLDLCTPKMVLQNIC